MILLICNRGIRNCNKLYWTRIQKLNIKEDIECFVMLVVVTESGGRKFEEKKQAYLLLSFSLLNAILVAVCNQISAFSFITPVLSILI